MFLGVESIYHAAREAPDREPFEAHRFEFEALLGVFLIRLKERIPAPLRSWLRSGRTTVRRASVHLNRVTGWPVLRRLQPYHPDFGCSYGNPLDRYYIEHFLSANAEYIRGRVAETGDDSYARLFGGSRVERCEVLDLDEYNPKCTLRLDLAQTASAPQSQFDCILCLQTLFEIYDHAAAVASLYKMLKPGGVLLVSLPGISQKVRGRMLGGAGTDYWRYTADSASLLFAALFGRTNVEISTYGNVLAATAFLNGLVERELTRKQLDFHDPDYEVIIGVRAVKGGREAA